jgi:hypothetical protein
MITKFGKRFITSYLAGGTVFPAQEMAFGIDSTAVDSNGNDTRLGFEFYRFPISLGTIDIQTDELGVSTYAVVYKTTIPQDVAGVIKEVGLYPTSRGSLNATDSKFITDFENNMLWFDENLYNPELVSTPTPRVGSTMFKVQSLASSSKEFVSKVDTFNLAGYSSNDTITLAYNQADTNLSSIKVKFYSSDTDYLYTTFSGFSSTGESIKEAALSTLAISGTPDSTSIVKVGVEVTAKSSGDTVVYLDGLRINDEDTFDPRYGIIARSVLPSPLIKLAGRPVDIEYRLALNF